MDDLAHLELGQSERFGYAGDGMIDFTRAFTLAWERTVVILFAPFNLEKWFTIGFSAFLAGLLAGGNGFNFSYNGPGNQSNYSQTWTSKYGSGSFNYHNNLPQVFSGFQTGTTIALACVILVLAIGFIVLIYWLGARGQFLFLDNIVRNRGAIAWPWKMYRGSGNRVFVFYLLFVLFCFVLIIPFAVVGIVLALPMIQHHRWPEGAEWISFAVLSLVYLACFIPISIFIFIFREMGVPLIFRHDLSIRAAVAETWKLMGLWPGSLAVFILLRIALFIALAITGTIICCLTCCIEVIPYIGTVFLLPALIYIKCFTLDCLAQFGPYYDVWIVDVPVTAPPATLPPPSS